MVFATSIQVFVALFLLVLKLSFLVAAGLDEAGFVAKLEVRRILIWTRDPAVAYE